MDTYSIVTEKIINLLEQDIVPWRRPWSAPGLPRNFVSNKPYRGINVFLLAATKYISPFWLTMKQANQLGGSVRRGEHSQIVVFWKIDQIPNGDDEGNAEEYEAEKTRRRFFLRYYRLFNMEQCELPKAALDKVPAEVPAGESHQHDSIEAAEQIIAGMPNPPDIRRAGTKAFYNSVSDRITLPPCKHFTSAEEEAATRFHEYAHATGSAKRLNRTSVTEAAPFGSPIYSFEELIAEMSAAYLCAEAKISPVVLENQAAYIQGWLAKLHSDKRIVVHAAAQAQKAADYIFDCKDHSIEASVRIPS